MTFSVLLVEDNEGDVEIVRRALESWRGDCEIAVAYDGLEALHRLHGHKDSTNMLRPDLILLDINMPGMNGKECLRVLKRDDKLKSIPVAILTSSQAASDVADCYANHANCYVVKPFDIGDYIDVVQRLATFWADVAERPLNFAKRPA